MRTFYKGLLVLLLAIPANVFAQESISGTVTESTGMPIPGVNVIVKNTTKGAVTDFDGNYTINNVQKNDTLVYSYIGFITQEIVFVDQASIDVTLEEDSSTLDEVVVVGYGSTTQRDLTGAVNQISTEDFNKGQQNTASQLITGKIAGVNVTSGGGAPGEGSSITIRGLGSLSLQNNPLYVVDGFPISNDAVGGSRNPLDFINPNDIESITVLKDASATAIYGSRAANGVILITTKKGKGLDFKFNYSSATTVYTPTDYVDVLNGDQFRALVNEVGNEDAISRLGTANTNWQDLIYRDAFGSEHNFSTTGNIGGFMPMRASLGYSDQDGILENDNFTRTTASINLKPSFMDGHLKFELNGRGMYNENTFGNRGAIGTAVDFDPTQSVYDPTSIYSPYFTWLNSEGNAQYNLAPTNPVALLNEVDDTAEVRRFIGNAKVDYKFHFFPDITATVNVGLDKTNSHGRTVVTEDLPSSQLDWNGSYARYTNDATNKLFDTYLTYSKDFDTNSLTAVAGYSYQSFENDNYSYDSESEEEGNEFEFIDKWKSVLLSYFGRINYNFDDRYIIKASLRADASSKLNPDDRWGYFPSAAVAWNIDNEDFFKSNTINQLKLRVGYGEVGNVNGLGDYNFLTRYTRSRTNANYQLGNIFYQTYRPEAVNEDLRWEIGQTLNLGLDYALFNDRISGKINAYVQKTEDLISFVTVSPFTNFSSSINKNVGDMENRGIEFELNVIPVQTEDFTWRIGYNIAVNDNEITSLPSDIEVGGINGGTGNNVQLHREGESPYSYYVYKQIYDENGRPIEGAYVDRNGDNIINDEDKYLYKD
ncbi:MAG TPA: SusC/RagA family TonB-linked outer membrane protein, partial [Flavobacteriaceae bacterium]|nr:SusC/RagA family TonB-linked outer membrane protein [Flavobacteriaceae bacterium]